MQVFKTSFLIFRHNLTSILVYLIGFSILAITLPNNSADPDEDFFSQPDYPIAVIDRDHSETSQAIIEYFNAKYKVVPLEDDPEVLQDELYFANVAYILFIPEQFEKNLQTEEESYLENIKLPNYMECFYIDLQAEQLVNTIKAYSKAGYSGREAVSKAGELLNTTVETTFHRTDNQANQLPSYYYFFKYIPFIFLAVIVLVINFALIAFNQEDIKKRMICSSTSLKNRNIQMTLAVLLCSILIYIIILILCSCVYKTLYADTTYLYYFLNAFAFLLVAISIGYLSGQFAKLETISSIGTVLSLAFSFLGGVFVPLEVMNEKVLILARFIPSYWYTIANDYLKDLSEVTGTVKTKILTAILLQFCFAAAIFSVALVISKRKQENIS